jgi:hypothetical protein
VYVEAAWVVMHVEVFLKFTMEYIGSGEGLGIDFDPYEEH